MGEVEPRELRRGSSGNRPHGGLISFLALPLSGQVGSHHAPMRLLGQRSCPRNLHGLHVIAVGASECISRTIQLCDTGHVELQRLLLQQYVHGRQTRGRGRQDQRELPSTRGLQSTQVMWSCSGKTICLWSADTGAWLGKIGGDRELEEAPAHSQGSAFFEGHSGAVRDEFASFSSEHEGGGHQQINSAKVQLM